MGNLARLSQLMVIPAHRAIRENEDRRFADAGAAVGSGSRTMIADDIEVAVKPQRWRAERYFPKRDAHSQRFPATQRTSYSAPSGAKRVDGAGLGVARGNR